MSDFGVICEFNPLHGGHQYLLSRAREMGAEGIVCVMSGNTVQRGSFAVADAYLRAEAAILCGADLVLELPFPWCSGSAETFARAGVTIASSFCDTLLFGSETGDLGVLRSAAEIAAAEEFRASYAEALSRGERAAEAYYQGLRERTDASFSSNDLLGIEYLRAISELGSSLSARTVRREGDAYRQETVGSSLFPSATAIRRLWSEGSLAAGDALLPKEIGDLWRKAREDGRLFDEKNIGSAIVSYFRLHGGEDFEGIAGCEGGLGNRLCHAAREAVDLEDLLLRVRTKRYTDTHLRRVMLYCLCGVRDEDLGGSPAYTRVLAANGRGREILAKRRKDGKLPVYTKPADVPRSLRQSELSERVDALFTLGLDRPRSAGELLRRGPRIL